jgi:hypothetical protein
MQKQTHFSASPRSALNTARASRATSSNIKNAKANPPHSSSRDIELTKRSQIVEENCGFEETSASRRSWHSPDTPTGLAQPPLAARAKVALARLPREERGGVEKVEKQTHSQFRSIDALST